MSLLTASPPAWSLGICVRSDGSTARCRNRTQRRRQKFCKNPGAIYFAGSAQKRFVQDEAELGARSRAGGGLRGAGTTQGRNFITKNAPLAAKIDLERPDAKQLLHSSHEGGRGGNSHRRMLRLPHMAGGDENSRVRAFHPATRGRLLSESWKLEKYRAVPWPGAAGIRRDSYFGDS